MVSSFWWLECIVLIILNSIWRNLSILSLPWQLFYHHVCSVLHRFSWPKRVTKVERRHNNIICSIRTAYRLVIISLAIAYRNITHVNILCTADWNQAPQKPVDTNLLFISFALQFLIEKVWYCLHTVGKLLSPQLVNTHCDTSKLLSVNYVCARSYSMKDKKTSSPISKNILFFKLRVFNLTQLQAVIFYCI